MTILLFDVDGTLTPSGDVIKPEMISIIQKISHLDNVTLGIVGGGNYDKIKWQLGNTINDFKYIFSECGAIVYVDGEIIKEKNMLDHCNRVILNQIIKRALMVISDMPIIYHGHQIDFRKGLIYVSPPGMQATSYERNVFLEMDKTLHLRQYLLENLIELNTNDTFEIVFGGSVGIAIYPKGWDKSQVIDIMKEMLINDTIYYFGDRTEPTGNDYPIYSHPDVNGISVTSYLDTIYKLSGMFNI